MATSTLIDWVEDVCYLAYFMAVSYENKIYSVGGITQIGSNDTTYSDSYLRIVDFSKPVDSTKEIDISVDNISIAIRLPDNVPRLGGASVLISDGIMHMLPGTHAYFNITDASGSLLLTTAHRTNLKNKVWNFDIESRKWDVQVSGITDLASYTAVAIDAEKQIGWYYGGWVLPDAYWNGSVEVDHNSYESAKYMQDLYRLDRGEYAPTIIGKTSPVAGNVVQGELVYIQGAGKAGILVLLGGNAASLRSMETVNVYDIATSTWFIQSTTAQKDIFPAGRVAFCSVVASAGDNSSHNIYILGGSITPDVDRTGTNEMFILTLPAFHWVLVYPLKKDNSEGDIRRLSFHRCLKVHEKHMVAYRGYNVDNRCDSDNGLKKFQGMMIFDMSALTWTTKVQLENPKYSVPQALYGIIGGNATGNATTTEPSQGFNDPELAKIFATQVLSNNTAPVTALPTNDHSQSKVPAGAITGGIVGGLVLLLLISGIFFWRRRQRMRVQPQPPTELECTTVKELEVQPSELKEDGLHELQPDQRSIYELPTAPTGHGDSVLEN